MMRPPTPVVILDCDHVETRPGQCATTDCPNYDGAPEGSASPPAWMTLVSVVSVAGILLSVRVITGRWMVDIIMDALPPLF